MFITSKGFKPNALIATIKAKIRFHNETDKTQVVRLTSGLWSSPPIRPGHYATFAPGSTAQITCTLAADKSVVGYIDPQPWYPPEDTRPGVPTPSPSP